MMNFLFSLLEVRNVVVCGALPYLSLSVQESRDFNMDLTSKVLFAKCNIVPTLVRSGVSRYVDFKDMKDLYLFRDGNFVRIPASKGDMFQNRDINPKQKRVLMKFLTQCLEYDPETTPASWEGWLPSPLLAIVNPPPKKKQKTKQNRHPYTTTFLLCVAAPTVGAFAPMGHDGVVDGDGSPTPLHPNSRLE